MLVRGKQDDSYRINHIILEQQLLIEEFRKTGDPKIPPKFLALSKDFQLIHKKHQLRAEAYLRRHQVKKNVINP